MSEPQTVWDVIYAFYSREASLRLIVVEAPNRHLLALRILLLAGLSEAVGQSVVLFANRVKPVRFALSLLISALIFVVGIVFWVVSIGFVARFVFGVAVEWQTLALGVAFSYVPLLFSFLALVPYVGQHVIRLLYVNSYIVLVRMLAHFLEFAIWQAFLCAGIGFLLIQLARATVGRPVIWLSDHLLDLAAGTDVRTNLQEALLHVIGLDASTHTAKRKAPEEEPSDPQQDSR